MTDALAAGRVIDVQGGRAFDAGREAVILDLPVVAGVVRFQGEPASDAGGEGKDDWLLAGVRKSNALPGRVSELACPGARCRGVEGGLRSDCSIESALGDWAPGLRGLPASEDGGVVRCDIFCG